jgi:site-specific DNA-methyltransferase (adenine-specific)
MSHYLKIICDLIFGMNNYRSEITWLRSKNPKGSQHDSKRYSPDTDIILYYSKSNKTKLDFSKIRRKLTVAEIEKKYDRKDEIGRFTDGPILRSPSMGNRANLVYEYRDYTPGPFGWRVEKEKLLKIEKKGNLGWSTSGKPYRKLRPENDKGKPVGNFWGDIAPINPQAIEKLGYPTQKPEVLMERIILASSNEDDVVADFFCGCGTTIAAAQKLKRQWIGSDISHLAVKLITKRLVDSYGEKVKETFEIEGFPKDIASAKELAAGVKGGRLKFEEWIVEVLLLGILNEKRNQMGFDGYFTFDMNGKKNVALIEVKSGKASPTLLNHFIRTVEDRNAQMGVFVCFAHEVTDNMQRLAKKQGQFMKEYKYEKIQILTVEDLLDGKLPERPASKIETFKKAEKKIVADADQGKLSF